MTYAGEDGVHNAIIRDATIGVERDFMLGSWVHVMYDKVSGQGFGGFALYLDKSCRHHSLLSTAGHWIYRVLQIAGVEKWDDLPGKAIRCRVESGRIEAIGHITESDWFCPSNDFKALRREQNS